MKLICLLYMIAVISITARAQTFAWAGSMGGPAVGFTPSDKGAAIKTDAAGNVYTTGNFVGTVDFDFGPGVFNMTAINGTLDIWDMFIQKTDVNGNFVWAKQLIGESSAGGYAIGIDASSNIYVSGIFRGTKDFDPGIGVYNLTSYGNGDIYILKLDANGNFIWAKQMGGNSNDGVFGIAIGNDASVYTVGRFESTVDFDPSPGVFNLTSFGSFDIFVSKLDNSGNFVWAKQIGGIGHDYGNAIATDAAGNICITGHFTATADFDPGLGVLNYSTGGTDIFVEKLDVNGNLLWAKQMVGNLASYGYGIAIDNAGNIYYTGSFWGTVDFDPGSGINNYTSIASSRDIFISKLDASGNFIWAKQIGTNGDQESYSITLDASANCYTTGYYSNTVDFDPGPGTFNLAAISDDVFIEKLDASGNFIWAGSMGGASNEIGYAIAVSGTLNIYSTGAFRSIADFDPGSGVYNLTSIAHDDIFIQKLSQTTTAIVNPDNQFQIQITPNPSNGEFYFRAKGVINKKIEINITDMLGQRISQFRQIANTNDYVQLLDLKKFAAGLYNVEVVVGNKIYLRRIIKNK